MAASSEVAMAPMCALCSQRATATRFIIGASMQRRRGFARVVSRVRAAFAASFGAGMARPSLSHRGCGVHSKLGVYTRHIQTDASHRHVFDRLSCFFSGAGGKRSSG